MLVVLFIMLLIFDPNGVVQIILPILLNILVPELVEGSPVPRTHPGTRYPGPETHQSYRLINS